MPGTASIVAFVASLCFLIACLSYAGISGYEKVAFSLGVSSLVFAVKGVQSVIQWVKEDPLTRPGKKTRSKWYV